MGNHLHHRRHAAYGPAGWQAVGCSEGGHAGVHDDARPSRQGRDGFAWRGEVGLAQPAAEGHGVVARAVIEVRDDRMPSNASTNPSGASGPLSVTGGNSRVERDMKLLS